MLPVLLALGVSVVAVEEPGPRSCVLYVRTADEWAPLRSGPVDREIVPLNSRSERVPCAAMTKDGIHFRLWAGGIPIEGADAVEVILLEHALGDRVVAVGNDRRLLVDPRLPHLISVNALEGDARPWFARQDGIALPVMHGLRIDAGDRRDGDEMWLLKPDAIEVSRQRDPVTEAWVTTPGWLGRSVAGRILTPAHVSGLVDQVVVAGSRPIEPMAVVRLRLLHAKLSTAHSIGFAAWKGEGPEWPMLAEPTGEQSDVQAALAERDDLRVSAPPGAMIALDFEAPPTPTEGRTSTLFLTVWGSGSWPPGPDAPRASRTPSDVMFVDVAHELGINMVHFEGPDLQLDIRPTMGPGAAWGDVDGDGWVDLFLPQGGGREGSEQPKSRFYRSEKGQRFIDESAVRGLALTGAGMGALFYDADGDGDLDLFVANYGRNRFLVNDGTGKFTDTSASVGLDSDLWHAAVSAADYDADGDLDLYVTSYLRYDTSAMPSDEELGRYRREDPVEMLPFAFPGERKLLLRCDLTPGKDGAAATIRHVDAAKELGLDDPSGRGMQAIWWDFDRDGDQDLYLANDVSPNRFWRNEGGGKFKDVGFSTGLDDPRGCMGLAAGDIDGDLDEDLFITNWQLETNALYVNNLRHTSAKSRVSTFRDRAVEAGVAAPSVGVTGWGAELADFDLDGDLDLFYANGYTSPDYESTGICVGQPCHYLENDGAGEFTLALEKAGPDVALPLAARAAIGCDYDQDGDLDIAVTANNGRFRLLRNDAPRGKNHWLGLRLKGANGNTRAIGAQVVVEAGDKMLLRSLRAGTSYLSGNAPELHFGLGEATSVTSCTVRWPSGKETTHAIDGVDRYLTIAEPQ